MTKIKLLLVDKSEIFRGGLQKLLECHQSIEVVCARGTALGAVESAEKHKPNIMLIDTELSECSGIEVMQRIHERMPEMRGIVLTNSMEDGEFIASVKAGARAYISKDISIENLVRIITLVSDGEVIVSPPMATRLVEELHFLGEYIDAAKIGDGVYLSNREKEVISLVAQGLTNRDIAATLFVSEHTAKVHLRNIMLKLHAHTRQQAVALLREKAIIQDITLTEQLRCNCIGERP